jgi:hypothetical protein
MARYRRHFGRRRNYRSVVIAVAAGLALAAAAHGTIPGAGGAAVAASIPGGSAYTPHTWAVALLGAEHLPQTPCNVSALTAWESAEGGNWQNPASGNPLNTTLPEPGSHAINPAGVQAYLSWQEGFAATIATLNNGDYPGILAALRVGGNAQAVADAVGASPWGTGYFSASC